VRAGHRLGDRGVIKCPQHRTQCGDDTGGLSPASADISSSNKPRYESGSTDQVCACIATCVEFRLDGFDPLCETVTFGGHVRIERRPDRVKLSPQCRQSRLRSEACLPDWQSQTISHRQDCLVRSACARCVFAKNRRSRVCASVSKPKVGNRLFSMEDTASDRRPTFDGIADSA